MRRAVGPEYFSPKHVGYGGDPDTEDEPALPASDEAELRPATLSHQVFGGAAQMPPDAFAILDGLAEWALILTLCRIQTWLAFGVAQAFGG